MHGAPCAVRQTVQGVIGWGRIFCLFKWKNRSILITSANGVMCLLFGHACVFAFVGVGV